MKKMLITCLAVLFAVAAQAQDIMVVHPHEATPQQYEVANIDSMTWENATTLHIYFKDKTAQDFAIANVDSLTWLVVSEPEPGMTIGQVTLGVGEAFIINDSLTEARSTDCTVRFSPTVVEEDTKLVIRRATSVPPVTIDGLGVDETYDISEGAVAVDVSLGDLHKLNGMVEIRIPMGLRQGEVPGVAWYNEETNAWEPIEYEYDTKTGEVVVWSNHLSIIECYRIKGEHTNNARLEFYSVPFPDNSVDELLQMVNDAVSGTVEWADYISNWYGVFSTLGFDITWSALNAGGVESLLFEKTSEKIGNVGTLFAIYDILRAGFSGDDKTAGINTMKYLYSQVSSALSDAIGTSIMSAAMCSVAIIDYALNQLYEQMISDRRDLYLRSYQKYYSRNTSDGLKHHYRSAPEWYRLLLPAFKKGSPTIEAVNNEVDQIVDDYVNEYWNLSDDDQILYWLEIGGPQWSYSGGLNNDLKKELADNHKAELYRDVFPRVFDAIGREMRTESYNILYDSMKDYAKLMNQVIRLELAGQAATEGTSWEGCKVRFKELPSTITDPANWESKLSAEGKGSIRFRFFAFASENVTPTLEVVDGDGRVVRDVSISFGEGVNTIDIGDAPMPMLDLSQNELMFVTSGGTDTVKVTTNKDEISLQPKAEWLKATYNADTKEILVEAQQNKTSKDREGFIVVAVEGSANEVTDTIIVKQKRKSEFTTMPLMDRTGYAGAYISVSASKMKNTGSQAKNGEGSVGLSFTVQDVVSMNTGKMIRITGSSEYERVRSSTRKEIIHASCEFVIDREQGIIVQGSAQYLKEEIATYEDITRFAEFQFSDIPVEVKRMWPSDDGWSEPTEERWDKFRVQNKYGATITYTKEPMETHIPYLLFQDSWRSKMGSYMEPSYLNDISESLEGNLFEVEIRLKLNEKDLNEGE